VRILELSPRPPPSPHPAHPRVSPGKCPVLAPQAMLPRLPTRYLANQHADFALLGMPFWTKPKYGVDTIGMPFWPKPNGVMASYGRAWPARLLRAGAFARAGAAELTAAAQGQPAPGASPGRCKPTGARLSLSTRPIRSQLDPLAPQGSPMSLEPRTALNQ